MTDFARLVAPAHCGRPSLPGAMRQTAASGRMRVRVLPNVGWRWEERYGALANTATVQKFLTLIDKHWHQADLLEVTHPDFVTLLGLGGGTPLVNGASQTGASLVTDGWPATTAILKAGDVLRVAVVPFVVQVTADVSSDGVGNATLAISPPIPVGSSPANNAAITTNGTPGAVKYSCVLERYDPPVYGPTGIGLGLLLGWRELA